MPKARRPAPLYQRGDHRLYKRADRAYLQIVWYDADRKRERSVSAGTADVEEGKAELDRLYLESRGTRCCPTCGRPFEGLPAQRLTAAIADYLVLAAEKVSYQAIQLRLDHVLDYLEASGQQEVMATEIDQAWVDRYRKWARDQHYMQGKERRQRAPSTVEGSIAQLAAAITATQPQRALFRPVPLVSVNRSPAFRADVKTLAAMFRYCLDPQPAKDKPDTPEIRTMLIRQRTNLLWFLRASVATWARPDAVMDINLHPKARQWFGQARVLALNPDGRLQTRKYRPTVPIARQLALHFDAFAADLAKQKAPPLSAGLLIPVASIRKAWDAMARELELPTDGEAGTKLIRRTMATLARKRLGEEHWAQGKMMLGHTKAEISDIYAVPDPANMGRALAVTEAIIDEVESLSPGAFYRTLTAQATKAIPLR